MRRLAFTAVLASAVCLAGAAEAARCAAPKSSPKIQLQIDYGTPGFVHDLDTREIRGLVSRLQGYTAGPWHLPLGLTVTDFDGLYETTFNFYKAQGGGYCVALARAKISLGYQELSVYISRDYAEGSCEFNAILDHERAHVAIDQAVLKAYKPRLEEALRRMLRAKKVIFVYRKAEARAAYALAFQENLGRVIGEMERDRNQKNGAIDTKDNYRRVNARCSNW